MGCWHAVLPGSKGRAIGSGKLSGFYETVGLVVVVMVVVVMAKRK